ncbi:hypothetical protein CLAIMM_04545 isoform 1 [Cladophialophora immunda]|nr:hypothetical protein CLAIMM_04545 isoform 1 [Cladophialophora immunda]
MAFFFVVGTKDFTSPLKGYEGVTAQCHNCGNWSAHPIQSWDWFTFCFVPVIPLGGRHQEVRSTTPSDLCGLLTKSLDSLLDLQVPSRYEKSTRRRLDARSGTYDASSRTSAGMGVVLPQDKDRIISETTRHIEEEMSKS